MDNRYVLLALALAALLFTLAGCPAPQDATQPDDAATGQGPIDPDVAKMLSSRGQYPIPWAHRDYTGIHDSAKQAWWLVETAYFVVKEKYSDSAELLYSNDPKERERGSELRASFGAEMERSIFGVNEEVESLFLDAITAEPENALNYATYALYLKARRRYFEDGTYENARPAAIAQVDKAIELWPDDAGFYMLKAYIYAGADRCHEWYRTISTPAADLPQVVEEVRLAYGKAAQYYPDNGFINYARALEVFIYTPPDQLGSIREELLREIREGNRKPKSIFYHGPPVTPFPIELKQPKLFGTEKEAIYVDQWNNFGHVDTTAVDKMVEFLAKDLSWPEDKETVGDLMFFLYRLGATKPFSRSFFSLQPKILIPLSTTEDNTEERTKLQVVLNFLNAQYRDSAKELVERGFTIDATKYDMIGINQIELGQSSQNNVMAIIQPRQGAFIQKAEEVLEFDTPLSDNPREW